ncbi:hypothetical protein U14_01837 [Candidatus Moduliflexus flocculans]|uniref:Uncharacterized protein n=1 Tax=Candidatus Moduliflexus flocculans TaxID=1499966 RepID=A0A0S6VXH8_9BACT|nr:hypothetical protein U14_01837 [Candidatus Moduliflexus flocculans]
MNITSACCYHYLFSHIPNNTETEARRVGAEIAAPLIEAHHLTQPGPPFDNNLRGISILSRKNQGRTYLIQFLAHDTLITEMIFNQASQDERDAMRYWQETTHSPFPVRPDHIGQTTVLLGETDDDPVITARRIASECLRETLPDTPLFSQFDWGTLFYVSNSKQFVLLVTDRNLAVNGDHFLVETFARLELFRQKLVLEQTQVDAFKENYAQQSSAAQKILHHLKTEWQRERRSRIVVKEDVVAFNKTISRLRGILHGMKMAVLTIDINRRNLQNERRQLQHPLRQDTLLAAWLQQHNHRYRQIKYDWSYCRYALALLRADADQLRSDIELFPVKLWERELEELYSYYDRLKKSNVSESMLSLFEELFQNGTSGDIIRRVRKINETIIRELYYSLDAQDAKQRGPGIGKMLNICYNHMPKLFPDAVYHSLNHVRILGNYGVHGLNYWERQSKEILSSLATVMEWYVHKNGL